MRFHQYNLRLLRAQVAALAILALTACSALSCDVPATAPAPATQPATKQIDLSDICISVKVYEPDQEKALADAVSALDPANPIIPALGDYGRMRNDARACLKSAH